MVLTVEAIYNKDMKTSLFNNVNLVPPTNMSISGYPDTRALYPSANNLKFINPVKTTPGQITTVVFVPNGTTATPPSSINAANVIEMTNGKKGNPIRNFSFNSSSIKIEWKWYEMN